MEKEAYIDEIHCPLVARNPPLEFKHLSISALKEKWNNKEIIINHDYQRGYIWRPKQRRGLIDSIMEGASIGVLVTLERSDNKLEILDGQQRIITIVRYLDNNFKNNHNDKFADLDETKKSEINGYSIYYLQLKSHLSTEEIANHFIRLQEGTPLNTAEKVNAFVGKFKKNVLNSFTQKSKFYSKMSNKRFRALLLSAQLLLLELESDLKKRVFPSLSFENLKKNNEKYFDYVPETKLKDHLQVIDFLTHSLIEEIQNISFRDWISIYLLASYLLKQKNNDEILSKNFRKFTLSFMSTLKSFSIYQSSPPENMPLVTFQRYLEYKNLARKATSADSVEGRFRIVVEVYVEMFPEESTINQTQLSNTLKDLLQLDESTNLEFKGSMVWGYKTNKCEDVLLKKIIAEVMAAFMNSSGGTLLVGIDDTKQVLGVERDYECFTVKNWDNWSQTFANLINTYLGKDFASLIHLQKVEHQGKTVARIDVRRGIKPVYVNGNGGPEFWIKVTNTKQKLNVQEAASYIAREFSNFKG